MFRQFLENRIRKQENGYYCNLCENFLQTKKEALAHIDSTNIYHNTLKRTQDNESECEFSFFTERNLQLLVDNYILQIRPSEYRCHICNCVMHHVDSVFEHIETIKHLIKIKHQPNEAFGGQNDVKNEKLKEAMHVPAEGESNNQKQEQNSQIKNTGTQISIMQNHESKQIEQTSESFDCKLCNIKVDCQQTLIEHQEGKRHLHNLLKPLDCKLCNVQIESEKSLMEHQQGTMHKLNAKKYSFGTYEPVPNISNLPVYTCFLCDIIFHDSNTIIQHLKTPGNDCSITSLFKPNELNKGVFSCRLCLTNIPNEPVCLIQHTQGERHEKNAKRVKNKSQRNVTECDPITTCKPISECNSNTKRDIVKVRNPKAQKSVKNIFDLPVYICCLCDSTFSDYGTTVQHFTVPDNRCSLSSSLLKSKKSNTNILNCGLCRINVPNSEACLLQHTQGKRHKNKAKRARKKLQPNVPEYDPRTTCYPISECNPNTNRDVVSVCNPKAKEPVKNIFNLPVYNCFLCDSTFSDYGTTVQHFTKSDHECLISSLLKPKKLDTKILSCGLCLVNVPNSEVCLLQHTQGINHKYNAQNRREKSQQNVSEYVPKLTCNPNPKCNPSTKCDVGAKCTTLEPTQNIYNLPAYSCFFCKSTFSDKDSIAQHFFESTKSCLASSFIKKHLIVDNQVIYSCGLCCTSLIKSFDDLLMHTQGKRHKTNTIREDENTELNIFSCNYIAKVTCHVDCEPNEKCDENGRKPVQDVSSAYTCLFCKSNFSDKDIIVQHFFQPLNGCRVSSCLKRTVVNNKTVFSCILCHICVFETFDFVLHTQGKVHKINFEQQKNIPDFGISKNKSESKPGLKENIVLKKEISKVLMNISNINISYYCNICNITAGSDLKLFKHLNELQHLNLISKLPKDYKPFIYCSACQVHISEDEAIIKHLDSSEHKKRLFIFFANVDNSKHNETRINSVPEPITKMNNQTSEIRNKPSRKIRKTNNEDQIQSIYVAQNQDIFENKSFINIKKFNLLYKCYVCNITVDSDFQLLDHLNHSKHKNSLSTLPRDFVPYIYCPLCKSDIFEDEEMISHLESDGHKIRLYDLSAKPDSKTGNVNQNQVDLQINLVSGSKTILDELCSEMIRRPRRPNTDLNNKNKFTPHFSEEYSKMFLEMGPSNIFNVDQRKMEILKSGIELSFLLNDERLCLVCNQRMPNNLQNLYEHLLNVDHIRKLDQLVINDLEFEYFRDQFSDLALAKEFMIEVNDDVAFCFPCKVEIENDDNAIKNHVEKYENHRVESQEQKELTQDIFKKFTEQHNNFWYIVQRFWCQVCNSKFEYDIDFVEHIEGKKHVREVKKLVAKGMDISYDVCIPCASMSMGLPDTYTKHCEDKMHKYLSKSKDYAVPEMIKPAMNLLNNVEETAESLVLESNAAQFVEKKIGLVLKCLEEIVKSHYPEAKAYVFGSRASYLAFSGSDVDIFLDCGKKLQLMSFFFCNLVLMDI